MGVELLGSYCQTPSKRSRGKVREFLSTGQKLSTVYVQAEFCYSLKNQDQYDYCDSSYNSKEERLFI